MSIALTMKLRQRSPTTWAASSLSLFFLLATAVQAQSKQTIETGTTQTASNTQITAQSTNTDIVKNTAAATSAGTTSITDLPNLSSSTDSGTSTTSPTTTVTEAPTLSSTGYVFHLSDVPTIAGYGAPTQIIPWTAGAPFMQRSSLPDGTVFIIVGAILGSMGVAVLIWRSLVAWSLHRSVRKAAMASYRNDSMLKLSKPGPYGGAAFGAGTMSLERLSAPTGKLNKHAPAHSASSPAGRNSSLFFSPTAGGAGNHSSPPAALTSGNNRSSALLPAGYYAAPGAASPGGGVAPGSTPSRLSTLLPHHPSNAGYARQTDYTPSPPGSHSTTPSRPSTEALGRTRGEYVGGYERSSGYGRLPPETGFYSQSSNSMHNLHVPGGNVHGGRAPSANLEEMFEAHGNGSRERF